MSEPVHDMVLAHIAAGERTEMYLTGAVCAPWYCCPMRRVHVLEFEDLPWFPSWLRTCMTNLIVVFARKFGVVPVLSALVDRALREQGLEQVVDLGSGAGGTMPDVVAELREQPETAGVRLVMTDLYPNLDAIERFKGQEQDGLTYSPDPVDATALADAPPGLKTMINCFHHMRPAQARAILSSARDARQPLLIYEMGEMPMPFVLWVITLPIALPILMVMTWFLTLYVRPLTFRQVFFTYLVPLVPIFYAWDGQASLPRMYSMSDYDEILEGLHGDDYVWEKGPAMRANGKKLGTYVLGMPSTRTAPADS